MISFESEPSQNRTLLTTTISRSFSLSPYPFPVAITWKDAPEDQRPILGDDYIVRCEVTANPPATVDWLRNGDPVRHTLSESIGSSCEVWGIA